MEEIKDKVRKMLANADLKTLKETSKFVHKLYRAAYEREARRRSIEFEIGDKVAFKHNGQIKEAVVDKVNRKTVSLTTTNELFGKPQKWRVPFLMLEKI